ncbi:MAG: HAD family hydrolase [Bacillota bacterium]
MCHDIKLLAIDLDGSLLHDDKSISKYSIQVINKCRELGIVVFLATARPLRVVFNMLEKTCLDVDGIIANNGATVYSNGKIIKNSYIDPNIGIDIINFLQCDGIKYFDIETGENLYCSENSPFMADAIWNAILYENSIYLNKIMKITIEINEKFDINTLCQYNSMITINKCNNNLVQIMSKTSNKMNAIDIVLKDYGFGRINVLAFGDDNNDKDMIENCSIGVAVKNATIEIKNIANYICGSNQEDGVATWIMENLISLRNK